LAINRAHALRDSLEETEVSPPSGSTGSGLSFLATSGGTAPANKTVTITNGGGGTLSGLSRYYPDGTPSWLSSTLSGSSAPATLTVSISMSDPFGHQFGAGTYTTRIQINSTTAGNSPQYIDATLTLLPASSISAYASYDNGVMTSSLDSTVATKVFSNSMLGVGYEYLWNFAGYDYSAAGSAIKFNVQSQISGRTIAKATLRLYVYALRGDFSVTPQIRVNAFAADWNPSTLTWNTWLPLTYHTAGQALKNAPSGSALPLDFDVTTIVQNWASGTWGNYGFKLYPTNHSYPGDTSLQTTYFQSLEYYYQGDQRPQLLVEFQ